LDVLVGLTDVLAWERDLVSYLLTDDAVRLPAAAPAEVTTRTVEALGEAGLGCGFRCAPPELTPRRRAVTYVVTDAVPADAERLAAARGPDDMRHLVLVGASGIPALGGLPCTTLPTPPQGVDPARYLEQNHMALGAVVESLLADIPRSAA
jgi:hypothetical protein